MASSLSTMITGGAKSTLGECYGKVTVMHGIRRAAASAAALAIGGSGVALLVLGTGAAASASTLPCPGTGAGCSGVTTASVQIAASESITDSTPSISFTAPASLPGPAMNNPTVNLLVSCNDAAGYTVELAGAGSASTPKQSAPPSGFVGTGENAATIPFSDLSVVGSESPFASTPQPFVDITQSGAWTPNAPFWGVVADDRSGNPSGSTGPDTITDTYSLTIPNVVPDTYTAYIEYTIAGN
jgi:hypothetical protein